MLATTLSGIAGADLYFCLNEGDNFAPLKRGHHFFKVMVLVCFALICGVVFAQDDYGDSPSAKAEVNREQALDTVAYINQLNYAYTVMKTYNNVLAVQEEYEKISFDKIDVTRIPAFSSNKESMLNLIRSMADHLGAICLIEDDQKYFKECQEDSRRRAKKQMWTKVVAGVPIALKDASEVIVKQAGKGDAYTVSADALIALAGDLVGGPVKAVMDYDKTLDELRIANHANQREVKKVKGKTIDKAKDDLIKAEFEFKDKMKLDSKDILTPGELESFVKALKAGKPDLVYRQINTSDMRSHYQRFAPYWYYLASLAIQCKKYDVAIEASRKFFEEYRGLIKVDPMKAQTAIAEMTALIATKSDDFARIRELIKVVCDVNYNSCSAEYSYVCADALYHYLNDPKSAITILDSSLAVLEGRFEQQLVTYRNKYKEEKDLSDNDIPRDIDLIRARTLYSDILVEKKNKHLCSTLQSFCNAATASSIEKLFYVGRVRVKDLWKEAKNDVLGIGLYYWRYPCRKNRFFAELPISWFLLGEVETKIRLYKGHKMVAELEEDSLQRKIRKSDKGIGTDIVSMAFFCAEKLLAGVDSVQLHFPHSAWPIDITYKPTFPYVVQTAADKQSSTKFTPVVIDFMNMKEELQQPDSKVQDAIVATKFDGYSHFLLPFQYGRANYSTNFLSYISVGENRNLTVAYTNPVPKTVAMKLDITCYTKYGATMAHHSREDELDIGASGEWEIEWPSMLIDNESPAYVYFQYQVDPTAWQMIKDKGRSAKRRLVNFWGPDKK